MALNAERGSLVLRSIDVIDENRPLVGGLELRALGRRETRDAGCPPGVSCCAEGRAEFAAAHLGGGIMLRAISAISVAALTLLLIGCASAGGEDTAQEDIPSGESTPTSEPTPAPAETTEDEPLNVDMIEKARAPGPRTYENTVAAYEVLHAATVRDCHPKLSEVSTDFVASLEEAYAEDMAILLGKTGPVSAEDNLNLLASYPATVYAFCLPPG
ncbi:hypothetical protein J7E29_16560 [Streptomyces sp. ISL-90]|nr:hypothetical protein [Streptomyces sp. ISL-90]